MATLGLSKVFILDKYFTELQKYWETQKKLEDASSSNEAVHLQQRLQSLSSELKTLKECVQGENVNSQNMHQQNTSICNKRSTNILYRPINSNSNNALLSKLNNQSSISLHKSKKNMSNTTNDSSGNYLKHVLNETYLPVVQDSKSLEYNNQLQDIIYLPGPLTEDAVLKLIQVRFTSKQYYVNVGPILISINPYTDNKNPLTLNSMRTVSLDVKLLKVVEDSVKQQLETGYPQVIVLSGISGSGKTYASMLLLRQLFNVAGGGPETDAFKHLAAAFTVLRSLGSAKTISNSESSRIGHFIELQVTDGALYRTKIHCYFLDQTRVVKPLENEKNYHIFYQMLAGLTTEERVKLHLENYNLRNLNYLNCGDTRQDEKEDLSRFQSWKVSLGILGIPFMDVVRVLAAILVLGNIKFVDNNNNKRSKTISSIDNAVKCSLIPEISVLNENELNTAALLLGVSPKFLFKGITSKTYNTGSQLISSFSDVNMSNMVRDSLAKALYCRTVATIVRRANSHKKLGSTLGTLSSDSNESVHNQTDITSQHTSVSNTGSKSHKSIAALNNAIKRATDGSIGILDMFGFEDPSPSCLEHLCINLCAETMQHFYNTHIFKFSIESCRDESVHCDIEVDYVDNVPCIDLISSLRTGLLNILDVECSTRGSAESYIQKIKSQHKNNTRLFEPANNVNRRLFGVQHFAGQVSYDATNFLDINKDVVPDDLICIFHKRTCDFQFASHLFYNELKALYSSDTIPRGINFRISPTSHSDLLNGDEPVSTLTQDFHTRLDNLLRSLVHARPHFIRCIKSNNTESPQWFDRGTIIKQIRSLQILETVNLMANGYPHRMRFRVFNTRYCLFAPFGKISYIEEHAIHDCRFILRCIEQKYDLKQKNGEISISYAFGKKHIFMSEGIRQRLESLRGETRYKAAVIIQSVWRGWHARKKWPSVKVNLKVHHQSNGSGQSAETRLNSSKAADISVNSLHRIINMNNESCVNQLITRPRPQPITGTPPPDSIEKYDAKAIQQLCSSFGLDLEQSPLVPPSRCYTICGDKKVGYPQTRIMKNSFPENVGNGNNPTLKKGDTVTVVGASNIRGHMLVKLNNHSLLPIPFQFLELKLTNKPL